MMGFPYITAATAAVLGTLQMLLMLYTALGRRKFKAGLGDGGNAALLTRMRMHGNLAENVPIFLILLGLVEMTGQWTAQVPWMALAFVAARLLHIAGLAISSGASLFRLVGAVATFAIVLSLAAKLAITLAGDTRWIPHLF
ncbi:MAG: MAPEG family protein [Rhizomicrobium sp.]